MANKLNNCYLINAPAGSGKTTEIKSIVQRCIIDNPKDNILCITYTNRAADELSKGILSKNVFIGTIHSFLHFFLKPYFAHQDILELYFETILLDSSKIKGNLEPQKKRFEEIGFQVVSSPIH